MSQVEIQLGFRKPVLHYHTLVAKSLASTLHLTGVMELHLMDYVILKFAGFASEGEVIAGLKATFNFPFLIPISVLRLATVV